ncbi:unnamed protein product [Phytophthora lilii]|uniref:Unnamed protein product n=1 Tax=Phytophthora lilii TaxID=2077276 RepID=A0A9W6WU26_9STRA|nr:unnamed protein product [Phytophthora lilii]
MRTAPVTAASRTATMASKALKLFSPLTLGGKNPVQLQHRIIMAPLTRLRTGKSGVPTDLVAEYYEQRSTPGGLLIAKATNISPTARGYFGSPGLYTREQVEGWKKVTLWNSGRVGHTLNQPNGEQPVSSSALRYDDAEISAVTREDRRPHSVPRALETHKIPGILADYKRAAEYGVELHGANGYLLEQCLCDSVNNRTDGYGGSIENRSRLTLEALEAVLSSLDSSQLLSVWQHVRLHGLAPQGDVLLLNEETEPAWPGLLAHRGASRSAPDSPEYG